MIPLPISEVQPVTLIASARLIRVALYRAGRWAFAFAFGMRAIDSTGLRSFLPPVVVVMKVVSSVAAPGASGGLLASVYPGCDPLSTTDFHFLYGRFGGAGFSPSSSDADSTVAFRFSASSAKHFCSVTCSITAAAGPMRNCAPAVPDV